MFAIKRKLSKIRNSTSRRRPYYRLPSEEKICVKQEISTNNMPSISQFQTVKVETCDDTSHINSITITPLLPMLAKPVDPNLIDFTKYIYEEKYDGERMLAVVYDNSKPSTFYTRTLKISNIFKYKITLRENVKNCIFDGELVYLNDEKKIVPICDTGVRGALKLQYRIFDIQVMNGLSVTYKSLLERKQLLSQCIVEDSNVVLSKYRSCVDQTTTMSVFDAVVNGGGEGLMLKDTTEHYVSNSRLWIKLKSLHINSRKEEFELYAHRLLKDKNGVPNIIECGYYDKNDKFVQITKVSSGIDSKKRTMLKLLSDSTSGKFKNRVIVTIIADKITNSKSLRHPSLFRIRTDIDTISVDPFIRFVDI